MVSLIFSRLYYVMMRRILVGDAAAVRESEQQGVFMGAAPSIFVASFPALATAWVTHLGLWGFVDPALAWVFRMVPNVVGLFASIYFFLIVPTSNLTLGMLLVAWYSRDTILGGIWSLWDTLLTVLQIVYVLGLSLVTPSGPLHFLVVHGGAMRGVLAGILQAAPVVTVLRAFTAPLLFVAWPVTAPLGFLAEILKAVAVFAGGAAWEGLWRMGVNVCIYMVIYVLPLPVVQDMVSWECETFGSVSAVSNTTAAADDWSTVCRSLQHFVEAKVHARQYPANSLWFDLILAVWFWVVAVKLAGCMQRTSRRNRGESEPVIRHIRIQVNGAGSARERRVEAALQRKEAKAAHRKQQKQRRRGH